MSFDISVNHLAQELMQCMHLCVPEDQLFPHAVMLILQQCIQQPAQKPEDMKFMHVNRRSTSTDNLVHTKKEIRNMWGSVLAGNVVNDHKGI
jgi:hypothetical protein